MAKKLITAALLLTLTIFPAETGGSDRTAILATHESPPYSGNSMRNKGLLPEIVTAAFARVGYKTKIEVVPWKPGIFKESRKRSGQSPCL